MIVNKAKRTITRAASGVLMVLVGLAAWPGAAGAEVIIEGVSPGATVTGDTFITARTTTGSARMVIQLIGPDGVTLTNFNHGEGVSLMNDGAAWSGASNPPGLYTVSAFTERRGRALDVARTSFTVEAEPVAAEAPSPEAETTRATRAAARVAPAEIASTDTSERDGGESRVQNENDRPAPAPRVSTGIRTTGAAAGMPAVGFARGTASAYGLRSAPTTGIGIEVGGEMPADADVLIIAWSLTESRVMDEFSHVIASEPYVITAANLNKLSVGEYELQLQPRRGGYVVDKVMRPLQVTARERPRNDVADGERRGGRLAEARGELDLDQTVEQPAARDAQEQVETSALEPSDEVVATVAQAPVVPPTPETDSKREWRGGDGKFITKQEKREYQAQQDQARKNAADLIANLTGSGGHSTIAPPTPLTAVTPIIPVTPVTPGPTTTADAPAPAPRPRADLIDEPVETTDRLTTDGFTVFTRSADTLVIHVSSSTGDDANDGLTPATAVKTAERGYDLLGENKPDWLLFKCGDTFETPLPHWKKSGRSASEKMLVGTYGEGARPYFRVSGDHFVCSFGAVNHVAFVGLHAHAVERDPDDRAFQANVRQRSDATRNMGGFIWLSSGGDVLVEDCTLEYFKFNLVFQGVGDNMIDGVSVRRNLILNAYGNHDSALGGHSSGIFAKRVRNLWIEENVFDHNGWNDDVDGADRTKFNHNIYIQHDCSQVTAIGNVISRGSAHGAQFRPGATVTNNLFVRNPAGFFVAQEESRVTRNVVLMSDDVSAEHQLGFGIDVLPTELAVIENNIISQKRGGLAGAPAINVVYEERSLGEIDTFDVIIRDNKICDWPSGDELDSSIRIGTDLANVINKSGNQMDQASGGVSNPPWIDPSRSVETYMESLGRTGSLDNFIEQCAARPRGQWDLEYAANAVNHYIRRGFDVQLSD